MNGLIVHAGGSRVSRQDLCAVQLPDVTSTWHPVPHDRVVDLVESALLASGLPITDTSFALARGGAQMFGVITLAGGTDYATVVGVRNSHDKSFPVSFCLGSRVFVCDNLAFSAEVVVKTKHSRWVMNRLPSLVNEGIAKLIDYRGKQDQRLACYKETPLSGSAHLNDLILRTYKAGAMPAKAIAEVIEECDSPRHEEFLQPTLWSYFNCVTEVLKRYSDLPRRTQRLHGVVDAECGGQLLAV